MDDLVPLEVRADCRLEIAFWREISPEVRAEVLLSLHKQYCDLCATYEVEKDAIEELDLMFGVPIDEKKRELLYATKSAYNVLMLLGAKS